MLRNSDTLSLPPTTAQVWSEINQWHTCPTFGHLLPGPAPFSQVRVAKKIKFDKSRWCGGDFRPEHCILSPYYVGKL